MIFKKVFPHTIQLEKRDCGPACLQLLCKYYGKFVDINHLRQITGTRKEGITGYDFIKAAEQLDLKCLAFNVSYGRFRNEVPLPCVVHWRGHHFVIVYKITKKYIFVSDPAIGLIKYSYKEFAKGWLDHIPGPYKGKRGVCFVAEPTACFQKDEKENKAIKNNYISALEFIWNYIKPYRKSIWQILIVMCILTLINALFPIITQSVIDIGIPAQDFSFITLMLVSSITLGLSLAIGEWIKQAINVHFSARTKVSMVSDYLVRLFKLPLSFFESRIMGDLLQRTYDFDRIESMIMGAGFNALLGVMSLLVFGSILFIYDSTLFWIYLAASMLYVIWVLFFWSIRKKMDIRYFSYLASNHSHWIELLSKISDIKNYNYGQYKRWQWEKVQVGLYKTRIKLMHVDQIQNMGSTLMMTVKDALLIYVAALAVIEGEMTIGMLIAVQYILGQLKMPMDNIVNFIVSSQLCYISYMRVTDIHKIPIENIHRNENDKVLDFHQPLVLRNVFFKYSVNDDYVLQNISLTIPQGQTVAIVGESGSGKSTLIKLLSQLYQPINGEICLGNMKLSSFSIATWREHCGVITQESALLKDSISNNIVFGREYDRDKLLRAVSVANIRREIEKMSKGYDTMIGENGRGVSEGQKQRILFARAIYSEPDFLFLDELTSTLDSRNESSIISSIRDRFKSQTIVIAAHRLATVVDADLIVVLKQGKIVEVGTHRQLIEKGKEYPSLFQNQLTEAA